MVALYTVWYKFIKIHRMLKMTPVLAAGIADRLCDMKDVVTLIDAGEGAPKKRGLYKTA